MRKGTELLIQYYNHCGAPYEEIIVYRCAYIHMHCAAEIAYRCAYIHMHCAAEISYRCAYIHIHCAAENNKGKRQRNRDALPIQPSENTDTP